MEKRRYTKAEVFQGIAWWKLHILDSKNCRREQSMKKFDAYVKDSRIRVAQRKAELELMSSLARLREKPGRVEKTFVIMLDDSKDDMKMDLL